MLRRIFSWSPGLLPLPFILKFIMIFFLTRALYCHFILGWALQIIYLVLTINKHLL